MLDTIIGILITAGAGAFAIWGARHKWRADRAKRQIDDYQISSDKWQQDAANRVERIKREAAGKAPIDPIVRDEFEKKDLR